MLFSETEVKKRLFTNHFQNSDQIFQIVNYLNESSFETKALEQLLYFIMWISFEKCHFEWKEISYSWAACRKKIVMSDVETKRPH